MGVIQEIRQVEADLQKAGASVAAVCREAGIARSTWDRWKSGATEPNMKTWRTATEAAQKVLAGDGADVTPQHDAA